MHSKKLSLLQINNFDLLRLFAALQVVVSHAASQLSLEFYGWYGFLSVFHGVPIFFVISGFLISASWESNPNVSLFARNRLLRIMPGLWVCIFVAVLAAMLFGYNFYHVESARWLLLQLAGFIYTPDFLQNFGQGSYNGALWTIPVELQFYCLVPLVYWLTAVGSKKTRQILFAVLVFFVIAWVFRLVRAQLTGDGGEPLPIKLLRYTFVPHVFLFLYGIVLQRISAHTLWLLRGKGHWWIAVYSAFCYLAPDIAWLQQLKLVLLGTVAISCAYTAPGLSRSLLGRTDISYGVYIYHSILLNVFIQSGWVGEWYFASLVLLLSCVAGYLSWVCVEKPCMRLKTDSIRLPAQPKSGAFGHQTLTTGINTHFSHR